MARPIKNAALEGKRLRMRLKRGRQEHVVTIIPHRLALGYQRWPQDLEGRWLARFYADDAYRYIPLGVADDAREPNGESVLSFAQAYAKARTLSDAPVDHGRLTVRAAMQAYIEYQQGHGHPVNDLISRTEAHILPALGGKLVGELTTEQLNRWKINLAAAPAMNRTKNGAVRMFKAAPDNGEAFRRRRSSTNRVLTMLKAALNRAFKDGKAASDIAWRRVEPFRNVDAARVRYLTIAESQRLINSCAADFRLLVQGALQTGARYGELIRLEVQDFNSDANTVAIRRSKTGTARHIVLSPEGAVFFAQICAGREGNEFMFCRADGEEWKSSQQARPMLEACAGAKIKPAIGFHILRHTWASLAVMNGMPLLVVAKNLGHTSVRMIEKHYGHLAPSFVAEEIRRGAPRFGFVPDKKIAKLR
jgi:integrase